MNGNTAQQLGRDHGGVLDAAVARWGGSNGDWCDLSTGINPVPYPIGDLSAASWTTLPDQVATDTLITQARLVWNIPASAAVLAVPGASAAIARIPWLTPAGSVDIPGPTYNEHAAAFRAAGWQIDPHAIDARVVVHPNNPDGRLWTTDCLSPQMTVIDESFCDTVPGKSLVALADRPGVIVLKSFGKFWGLAGLRLGFAIGDPELIAALADALGPWPVSGPALEIGARALADREWAKATRARLKSDADRLDRMAQSAGLEATGGTPLFRLYQTKDATAVRDRLARSRILIRIFPYAPHWVRVGLPPTHQWDRIEDAL